MDLIVPKYIQNALDKANITINGDKPHDIKLLDESALKRIITDGALGLGETYMEGWWECECLDVLSYQLCVGEVYRAIKPNFFQFLYHLSTKLINYQTPKKSKQVAQQHYNLDNHLFELMLGKSMAYSCAYWQNANDLDSAQWAKYELVCKKLYLTSEDTLLDIGCGWGGFAAYAAEHYGCNVVAISISSNQISYAKEHFGHLPIEFQIADYRSHSIYNPTKKQFTKLVSIGAFEHFGYKNYVSFFQLMREQLSDDGLFLLHTIGNNETAIATDRWINKYIFPNGYLPSMVQISQALESAFLVEDWHNFGAYYDNTLLAWNQNFANNWDALKSRFDTRFYRMWQYYLLMCAGMFRARAAQLWQIVLSKSGVKGGYESIR
ncbi:cyclopropane fatty acyl phospholipid synthase [Legionella maceachernii]|uniref:Cyclopropane fatty acyl phospholipid synthase n=1 Tax=Legionella maceachernii TaxID=466 RepID=A0A0W0WFJ5_9GAMM|nr:cyclopropane fatty acyl phospholipid synthase [Legionella maceachernii]KTD31117.1 cyclopropane fatty acyl phospholipid synthase [Legionella maceachernii]SJZ99162.1 cyclopropane-fatty-acyl-phospholipid synthase [Legionella maceachernii]SUP01223.1 Cyclopropane-fatty-acyl-phospholipid synthase [Legionella maceachernii]